MNAIRGENGVIEDETMIKKVVRTILPIYAIKVFAIQELRCVTGSNLTLEGLMGRLIAFELSNFDNFKIENVESTFKDKPALKEPKENKKKVKYVSSDSDTDEEDVEQLEALLARIFHRGKGKFRCKIPIMCFNCNEVGHIVARCLEKKNNRSGDKFRSKREENSRL